MTALDVAASDVHPARMEESFEDYAAALGSRGSGVRLREAGPGRPQPRRPQRRPRHGEVPAEGRRLRVPDRVHAVCRQAHGRHGRGG